LIVVGDRVVVSEKYSGKGYRPDLTIVTVTDIVQNGSVTTYKLSDGSGVRSLKKIIKLEVVNDFEKV
jgi:hypothetical protein